MKVQNKARFKLISICSKHTSADNQHLKRFDKQNKRCCMYCWEMQHSRLNVLKAGEKYPYSKECRGVYLFSLLLHMCESYSEGPVD